MAKAEWESSYNITLFIFIIIALCGLIWLQLAGVDVNFYITLTLSSFIVLMMLFFFFKSAEWRQYFRIPFETNTYQANYNFFVGAIVMFGINLLKPLLMPPTLILSTSIFQILPQGSFMLFFQRVFTAFAVEELFFAFTTMLIGAVVAWFIVKQTGWELSKNQKYYFGIAVGLLFSAIFFSAAHQANPTYVTLGMFVFALLFRLLVNSVVYLFGIFLFSCGMHYMNNLMYLGWTQFSIAMMTFGGIIVAGTFLLMLWGIIVGFQKGQINPLLYAKDRKD